MSLPLTKTTISDEELGLLNEGFKKMVEELYKKLPPEDKKFFYFLLYLTETYKAFFSLAYAIRMIAIASQRRTQNKKVENEELPIPVIIPDWLHELFADTEVEHFFNLEDFVEREEKDDKTYVIWKGKDGKEERYEVSEVYAKLASYGIDNTTVYKYVPLELLSFFIDYADSLEEYLNQGGTLV